MTTQTLSECGRPPVYARFTRESTTASVGRRWMCGCLGRLRLASRTAPSIWARASSGRCWQCSRSSPEGQCRRNEQLLAFEGQNVVLGSAVACYGATDRTLGALATVMRRWDQAERHLGNALVLNRRLAAPTWIAHTLYERARLACRRRPPLPFGMAREQVSEALDAARRIGLPALVARIERLTASLPGPAPDDRRPPRGTNGRFDRGSRSDRGRHVRLSGRPLGRAFRRLTPHGGAARPGPRRNGDERPVTRRRLRPLA